jgi:hypothetical protein
MKTRMLAAEAELARRDEAAGEPVGYTNIAGLEALSKGFVVSVCPDARQIDSLPLYTAAQPSALPPLAKLKDAPTDDVESAIPWLAGANCMREQAKALGCKAIKLPKPYGMQDHEKWLAQAEVIAAILAAGFTVEGD